MQEFEDKREGSTTTLVLKKTKTASSKRTIFMTAVLKEELKHWLKRLEMDEAVDPERYRNSGILLRLPNGLAVEPILIRKKLGKKFEEGFYKPGTIPAQTASVEAEPTISMSALLELLKDADPSVKAQLRLALLT